MAWWRSKYLTPVRGSANTSSRSSLIGSVKPTALRLGNTVAWDWAWQSPVIWLRYTAAVFALKARAKVKDRPSQSNCQLLIQVPDHRYWLRVRSSNLLRNLENCSQDYTCWWLTTILTHWNCLRLLWHGERRASRLSLLRPKPLRQLKSADQMS